MTVTGAYVANLLKIVIILALLPRVLTVTVTLTPALPITVTLYLTHTPINIRCVSIRPLSLYPSPFSLSFLFPFPFAFSLSLLSVCLSDICRGSPGGHISWQCISDDGGASRHAINQPISPSNFLASSEEAHNKQAESLPEGKQTTIHPTSRPSNQIVNRPSGCRSSTFFPAMRFSRSLSLSLSPPSLPLSLCLSPSFSLSLSPSLSDCQTAAGCGTADT